jgi:hypothetical protein
MKSLFSFAVLALAIFASFKMTFGAEADVKSSDVTGDIRYPREGDKISGNYTLKGRSRGAPDDFVVMAFLECPRTESFFPYGEIGKANRSFSQTIYHRPTDVGQWYVHLYVLPEADAEKLAAWHAEAARLVEAGQENKIEAFDPALMDEATKVASQKYFVERN